MNDMAEPPDASTRRYQEIIERVFLQRYTSGAADVPFERTDLIAAAGELGHAVPKNLGDVMYSFRYRRPLPLAITDPAPDHREWAIHSRLPCRAMVAMSEPVTGTTHQRQIRHDHRCSTGSVPLAAARLVPH
jgi:hypothetical protein